MSAAIKKMALTGFLLVAEGRPAIRRDLSLLPDQ